MRLYLLILFMLAAGFAMAQLPQPPVVPAGHNPSVCDAQWDMPNVFTECCGDPMLACKDYIGPFGHLEEGQSFHLWIFNRWGEVMWETEDPGDTYDFTFKGSSLQQGTYVWKIDLTCEGETNDYIGHINVLR